ncbi:hypothetical protein PO124_07880 [Bacillus licheniformis]|nr:hypothetical protein [Bacillus licheniformis]
MFSIGLLLRNAVRRRALEIIAALKNDPKLAAEVMKRNWLRPMEDIHKVLKGREQ